ncbi:ABC transporter permease [Kitasatospora sp. NBC_01266]|uniref:ABC transporter permease n=1 Tax=Kitasatospora sp. NBC_01266 TaxID=2903572 RepID=UPI002E2FA0EB|nr:ABC transporter permease [Kitasatospora sp. NBC_01266]
MTVPNSSPDTPSPWTPAADDEALPDPSPSPSALRARLLPELRVGAPIFGACLVLGVLMGAMWYWLAPEVPLVVHGQSVLYVDPEGEQRAGADGTFVLLGLGFGLVTALAAFLYTQRRGGGIVVAGGLTAGGLVGSLIAMFLGIALGPTSDIIAHAKQVGDGHNFSEALQLGAKGALLAWPMAALVALLALTAAFGKREQDPPPYWAGPVVPSAGGPVDELAPPVAGADAGAGAGAGSGAAAAPSDQAESAAAAGPDAPAAPANQAAPVKPVVPANPVVPPPSSGGSSASADQGADSARQTQ